MNNPSQYQFEIPLTRRRKRKKGEPEPEPEKPKGADVYQEIIHLPPEAGHELIQLLESKKQIITEMADREKKRFQEALREIWESVIKFSYKQELSEFDFQDRSFEWNMMTLRG